MAVVNGLSQKEISNVFAGLGSDFLSSADLAKLQESTMKDLSRFMDKPAPQQKQIETAPNQFMRSNSAQTIAYTNLKKAADQRNQKREDDAKIAAKKSFDGVKSGVISAFVSLFGRKEEKSSDDWNTGPRTA